MPTSTSSSSPRANEPSGQQGTALYEFVGEAETELSFKEGDTVYVMESVEGSPEWSWGRAGGKRGMFPSAFVELV